MGQNLRHTLSAVGQLRQARRGRHIERSDRLTVQHPRGAQAVPTLVGLEGILEPAVELLAGMGDGIISLGDKAAAHRNNSLVHVAGPELGTLADRLPASRSFYPAVVLDGGLRPTQALRADERHVRGRGRFLVGCVLGKAARR
jgi:hypothetical protein